MNGFIKSFSPILKGLKKYRLEIILLATAIMVTVTAIVIYIKNGQNTKDDIKVTEASPIPDNAVVKIFVDVSGAVKKPDLYQVGFGARIKDIIDKAGGLSEEADVIFFQRNFNLARIVSDQEKIYIPSITEINNEIFVQNQRALDYTSPSTGDPKIAPTSEISKNNQLININDATVEELDSLPGIGQVTANKIISGRPYGIIEELLTKKSVGKSVYEKIKSLISL